MSVLPLEEKRMVSGTIGSRVRVLQPEWVRFPPLPLYVDVAQLVEHLLPKQEVAGSRPVIHSGSPRERGPVDRERFLCYR